MIVVGVTFAAGAVSSCYHRNERWTNKRTPAAIFRRAFVLLCVVMLLSFCSAVCSAVAIIAMSGEQTNKRPLPFSVVLLFCSILNAIVCKEIELYVLVHKLNNNINTTRINFVSLLYLRVVLLLSCNEQWTNEQTPAAIFCCAFVLQNIVSLIRCETSGVTHMRFYIKYESKYLTIPSTNVEPGNAS